MATVSPPSDDLEIDPQAATSRLGAFAASPSAILFAALLFHALAVFTLALTTAYPAPIDEQAHYSYALHGAWSGELFPDFQAMRLWDHEQRVWSERPNHLGHPSPYYQLMGGLASLWTQTTGSDDAGTILVLRLANGLISLAGVALVLRAGMTLFTSDTKRVIFATAAVLFPKLGVLGGLINNDNMAFLAAGLAFYGLARRGGLPWLALGIVAAGWTKLTALLMVGCAVAFSELIALSLHREVRLGWRHGVLAAALLVAALPHVHTWCTYGSPVYTSSAYFTLLVAEHGRVLLDFPGYAVRFVQASFLAWPALEPANAAQIFSLLLALALIAAGTGYAWRHRREDAGDGRARELALGYACAAAAILPLHFYFGWAHYQATGHLIASYSRYYYALWPGLAVALVLARPAMAELRLARRWPMLRSPRPWVVALALLFTASIQFVIVFRDLPQALLAATD